MCLNPVTIKNPKYKNCTFLKSVDKEYVTVPCGHCSECSQKKVNDMVVRGYYEWLDVVSNGGFALFDTLTFSDPNCPTFNGWRYFSRRVYQLFIKRLFSNLEYVGFDVRGNLTYILTTEYGATTYRPHAHFLVFSKVPELTPELLNEHIVRAWRNVDSKDILGRNDLSKDVLQRVVNSVYGIRYVCKYITKDCNIVDAINYHRDLELSQYFFEMMRNLGKVSLDEFTYSDLRQIFLAYKETHDVPKDFQLFNFTMVSHGLGLYYLDKMTIDDMLNDVVIQDQSKKQYTVYSVPSYYIRKSFYNYNKYSKRYTPNEYFSLLRQSKDKKIIDSFKQNERKLEDIFSVLSVNVRRSLFKKYSLDCTCVDDSFKSSESVRCFVDSILNGREFNHFVKYVVYFRNVHVSPYHFWLYENNLESLDNSFIDLFCEYRNDALVFDSLSFRTDLNNPMPTVLRHDDFSSNLLFNELPCFDGYDQLYNLFKDILYFYKKAKDLQYQRFKNEIEKFHSAYKQSINSSIIFY